MQKANGIRKVLFVWMALFLTSCATTDNTPAINDPGLSVEVDQQYMCISKVHLSDLTKGFLLPAAGGDSHGSIQAGQLLDKAVQATFWVDSTASASGRVMPAVVVGFDGATGVYTDTSNSNYYAQISLQFQIFRPTGQSYMDIAVGQAAAAADGQAASQAVIEAAMSQALHRLEGILVSAEICRRIQ
jgi:hypothetical protein